VTKGIMLTAEEIREIEIEAEHYPKREAVCIDALKIVQRHRGWVSDESVRDILPEAASVFVLCRRQTADACDHVGRVVVRDIWGELAHGPPLMGQRAVGLVPGYRREEASRRILRRPRRERP